MRPLVMLVVATMLATSLSERVWAQQPPAPPTPAGRPFISGSVLLWALAGGRQDFDVFGFSPYNHTIKGSIDEGRPLGGNIHGGVFVWPDVTLSAEVSFRSANTGTAAERIQFHTTTDEVSSRYTDRSRLISILLGGRVGRRSAIAGHVLAGLTILSRTHSLTDRAGITHYPGGQYQWPTPDRDFTARATKLGIAAGADVLTSIGANVSVVWSARIHWTRRDHPAPQLQQAGTAGTLTLQLGAGLGWGR